MLKKTTSPNRDGLSAMQHDAIRLLASGCTTKYTALVLRLKYAQVKQWLSQDARFQTELAAQRELQKDAAQADDEKVGQSSSQRLSAGNRRRPTIQTEPGGKS